VKTGGATVSGTNTTSEIQCTYTFQATESNGATAGNRVEHVEKQNERILTLVKAVQDHQKKLERQHFSVDDSPYKNELQSRVAKVFCLSLGREVSDEALKTIIMDVLARESEDKVKFAAVMKWCKKKFSVFKTEEKGKCSMDYTCICTVMPVAFPFHNY